MVKTRKFLLARFDETTTDMLFVEKSLKVRKKKHARI
jgi:hypothetical protein